MNRSLPSRIFSGALLITGTTVGAGMLGIPLVTSVSGFMPAISVTALVWLFMTMTGLLLLEATLMLPEGASFLSISDYFLGKTGMIITGIFFVFLYYCLMVAYFAAGVPLLGSIFHLSGPWLYVFFALVFGAIVAIGPKSIDRVNIGFTVAMFVILVLLLGFGSTSVELVKLKRAAWLPSVFAFPILFSAFGYHNVIPSLCSYLHRDKKALRWSILIGATIPFVIYCLWQWLIIGSLSQEILAATLYEGKAVTYALQEISSRPTIGVLGSYFALFAIITSVLGVSFSLIDFLGDGLNVPRTGFNRVGLTLLTFVPPCFLTIVNPSIFDQALSLAGGIGESFLNGLLPVLLVFIGRYIRKLPATQQLKGGRSLLLLLTFFALFVLGVEIFELSH